MDGVPLANIQQNTKASAHEQQIVDALAPPPPQKHAEFVQELAPVFAAVTIFVVLSLPVTSRLLRQIVPSANNRWCLLFIKTVLFASMAFLLFKIISLRRS